MRTLHTGRGHWVLLALLAGMTWLALNLQPMTPPQVIPASAGESEFSAERAREHLREITRSPRPMGSPGHAAIREYLVEVLQGMGLETRIQQATSGRGLGSAIAATEARNIVARLPGGDSTGAVVLMAHYDSVVHSPGATDAGNGVVAILETLRALQAGPTLRNDVIALITDAEEIGLLGAQAWVDEYPLAADTGVVLNFEGRGHYGPVAMFRTAGGNGRLIPTLAEHVPGALADSLASEAFRLMPNDTDLSVFDAAGHEGMDFANAHGITHYHYPIDSYQAADPRSLQHHGEYMLPLARAFGGQDLSAEPGADRAYFSLPLVGIIQHPESWVVPLAGAGLILLVAVFIFEARGGRVGIRGLVTGAGHFTVSLVILPLTGYLVWTLFRDGVVEVPRFPHGTPYAEGYYLTALCLVILGLYLASLVRLAGRLTPAEWLAAPLFLFAGLALTLALAAPGASFLFLWPMVFTAAGLAILGAVGEDQPRLRLGVLVLMALPVIFMLVPAVEAIAVMMTFDLLVATLVMLVLVLALLAVQLGWIARRFSWPLPLVALAVSLGMLGFGVAGSEFDAASPKPNPRVSAPPPTLIAQLRRSGILARKAKRA